LDLTGINFVPNMENIRAITRLSIDGLSVALKDSYISTIDNTLFRLWEEEYVK
jgi:hypothetical protein